MITGGLPIGGPSGICVIEPVLPRLGKILLL